MIKKENFSLKGVTTMRVGGKARYFFIVENSNDLIEVIDFAKKNNILIKVLGGGSNVLFSDSHFSGLVLKNAISGFEIIDEGDDFLIKAGGGEDWDLFVKKTIDEKVFGLENLSGIPGTVGASVVSNIGAYGVEIEDFVERVSTTDLNNGAKKDFSQNECQFKYRESFFKSNPNLLVTEVTYRLSKKWRPNVFYKDLAVVFSGENEKDIQATTIRKKVLKIRADKFPDLKVLGTAGSFFKNPIISDMLVEKLKSDFPDLPVFEVTKGFKKVSLAFILDKICDLKGFRMGEVGLFEKQPLVLVNFGNATTKDILEFSEIIEKRVFEKTRIKIEKEVVVIDSH